MDRAISPLAGAGRTAAAGVGVTERWPLAMVEIAAIPRVPLARADIEACLGLTLPPANTAQAGVRTTLWCGPERWLVVGERATQTLLLTQLERAAAGTAAITDVSDARTVLRVAGAASALLVKGCAIDLDSAAMKPGRVTATSLARLHVLLHRVDQSPSFDVYVCRSYAEFLWGWFAQHAAEFD